jgi:hypothetical protein
MPIFEAYIRIKDKVSPEHPCYADSFHAGDVICIQPEGHQWGKAELASQEHAIIKIEADGLARLSADLLAAIPPDLRNGVTGIKRVGKVDASLLPASYQAYDAQRPRLVLSEQAIEANQSVRADIERVRVARSCSREEAREIVVQQVKKTLIDQADESAIKAADANVPRPILTRMEVLTAFAVKPQASPQIELDPNVKIPEVVK